ncbi:MAG TPA: hypothetical protein VEW95_09895 [Candidatus Limnocylindrales bacterium]|nr:hypothetical protein [Candidatus Limnocylindrales bacterium]
MTFWNLRRGGPGPSATQGSAALAVAPELAPIEIYTADSRIVGWIAPNGQRVTDLLTSQDELRLWRPSPGALDDTSVPSVNGKLPGDNGEWESLPTAQVILAMPPEWRASRQLRLHRRLRRAAVLAGPFNVTGNVHLPPGVEVGLHLVRSQTFVPLTDAYILHNSEPPFEHVVSVVIINSAHVSQIVPLVSLA